MFLKFNYWFQVLFFLMFQLSSIGFLFWMIFMIGVVVCYSNQLIELTKILVHNHTFAPVAFPVLFLIKECCPFHKQQSLQ